jgi:hypothetical protein
MVRQFRQVAAQIGLTPTGATPNSLTTIGLIPNGPTPSSQGMDVQKTVTMASIIEKETAVPEERAVVASVYYNRLARKIALQADHPQHGRLARKYVAPDLLVVDDLALLDPAHGSVNIDGRLKTLDLGRLRVDVIDQLRLGGRLQRGGADLPLHPPRAEQTPGQRKDH